MVRSYLSGLPFKGSSTFRILLTISTLKAEEAFHNKNRKHDQNIKRQIKKDTDYTTRADSSFSSILITHRVEYFYTAAVLVCLNTWSIHVFTKLGF